MTTQTIDRETQLDAEAEEARFTAMVDHWIAQAAAGAGPPPF
jgi:hypothetical protein